MHTSVCVSEWLTVDLSVLLPCRHTQPRRWTSHTLWFIHSTVQYAPDLSAPYSHASAPTTPSALHFHLSLVTTATPPISLIYTHPYTRTHTHPGNKTLKHRPLGRGQGTSARKQTHLPTFALMHLLINANTLVMWCVVRHGVQMSGISVLALATLSTTGGLYRRKNQQSHSHEAAVSITNTGTGIGTRPCAHIRPVPFTGKLATHKKAKRKNKKKKASDKSSQKTFAFWHAKTRAQLDHVLSRTHSYAHTPHKLSRTVTVQKGK